MVRAQGLTILDRRTGKVGVDPAGKAGVIYPCPIYIYILGPERPRRDVSFEKSACIEP